MAGHSKWKNIQYRKQSQDKRKSKLYAKFSREISNQVKQTGEKNYITRSLLEEAKSAGVPKDVIEKAVQKGLQKNFIQENEVIYEGFVEEVAFIIRAYSDNNTRTAAEIRSLFSQFNGEMSDTSFLFELKTAFYVQNPLEILEICDFVEDIEETRVFVSRENLADFEQLLAEKKITIQEKNRVYIPIFPITPKSFDLIEEFTEAAETISDVDDVFCNSK